MKLLPQYIDPFRLALNEASLEGCFDLSSMVRLRDCLLRDDGEATFRLLFSQTPDKQPLIEGVFNAALVFCCERCAEPMTLEMSIKVKLRPILEDNNENNLPEDIEPLVTNGEPVSLLEMVEEELLLASPMFPRHRNQGCPVDLTEYLD